MAELVVGNSRIKYTVVRSPNVQKRRISLTADNLEVIVPQDTTNEEIQTFLQTRVDWLKENIEVLRNPEPIRPWPQKFVNNAKVAFHGRYMPVILHFGTTTEVTVEQQPDRFYIRAPFEVAFNDRDVILQEAMRGFYAKSLKDTLRALVGKYAGRVDVRAPEIHVGEVEGGIGYFNDRNEPVFSTALVLAPKFVLEYVVVHELMAMKLKTRGKPFWQALEAVLPDYRLRAEWLAQNRGVLTSGQI
jgi:predicted metal-dependent hydrolase